LILNTRLRAWETPVRKRFSFATLIAVHWPDGNGQPEVATMFAVRSRPGYNVSCARLAVG
jgi:hypothetical protein